MATIWCCDLYEPSMKGEGSGMVFQRVETGLVARLNVADVQTSAIWYTSKLGLIPDPGSMPLAGGNSTSAVSSVPQWV
jgi:hypothetical protein